jgi:hypothetical protein
MDPKIRKTLSICVVSIACALVASWGLKWLHDSPLGYIIFLEGEGAHEFLKGWDRRKALTYTEPITDRFFASLNAGDYAAFSADFGEDFQTHHKYVQPGSDERGYTHSPASQFQIFYEYVMTEYGVYLSRDAGRVRHPVDHPTVYYLVRFSSGKQVKVNLRFQKFGDRRYVMHVRFDSEEDPKLSSLFP